MENNSILIVRLKKYELVTRSRLNSEAPSWEPKCNTIIEKNLVAPNDNTQVPDFEVEKGAEHEKIRSK